AAALLAALGPEARPASAALAQALQDKCAAVRRSAAAALGEIGPTAAGGVSGLIEALREDEIRDRSIALAALVKLGKRALPRLLDALRHPDPTVRRYAARALGKAPESRELTAFLALLLRDPDPVVREDARAVLRQTDPSVSFR